LGKKILEATQKKDNVGLTKFSKKGVEDIKRGFPSKEHVLGMELNWRQNREERIYSSETSFSHKKVNTPLPSQRGFPTPIFLLEVQGTTLGQTSKAGHTTSWCHKYLGEQIHNSCACEKQRGTWTQR